MTLVLCTGFLIMKVDLIYVFADHIYPTRSVTWGDVLMLIPRYIRVASVSYFMFIFIIGILEIAYLRFTLVCMGFITLMLAWIGLLN